VADDDAARAFYELSKRLKQTDKKLRTQFHAAMREAAKPVIPQVQERAREVFPQRGGAAKFLARKSRYRAVARTGATTAGVSIRAERTDPRMDTQGRMTHPVPVRGTGYTVSKTSVKTKRTTSKKVGTEFVLNAKGKKLRVVQFVPQAKGFFSKTIEGQAGAIRNDLTDRMVAWADRNLSGRIGG
jgi:hypothetical protein